MGLFFKKEAHIGLDIGETSIKIAEVKKNRQGLELAHAEIIPLPKGAIDNDIINDSCTVAQLIRKAITDAGLPTKVVTAVTGQNVFIRYLTLPSMPAKELAEAVKYEAESHIPIPLQEVTIDYAKIAEVNEDGVKKQEVMMVAARRNSINQLVSILREAGLEPVAIDVEPLALIRSAVFLGKNYQGKKERVNTFALVNMGTSTTLVNIVQNDVIRFTRLLPYGGSQLTSVLARDFNMSLEEAESMKRLIDLSGKQLGEHGLTVLLQQKANAILPLIEDMVIDIRRSLDFFRAQHHAEIERVYLTGGGALLKGLNEFVTGNLGIETVNLNPFKMMNLGPGLHNSDLDKSGMALAVAVGLALKEVN